jgi:hypothetical protein
MIRTRITLIVAIALWLAESATTMVSSGSDPFAFMLPAIGLETGERMRLEAGDPLVKVLPAEDPELSVFGATRTEIDADRLVADSSVRSRCPEERSLLT